MYYDVSSWLNPVYRLLFKYTHVLVGINNRRKEVYDNAVM